MRILLTGASGLVGGAVIRRGAVQGHEVLGITHSFRGELPGLASRRILDLADLDQLVREVDSARPDAIINCAAISEPAQCEADPAESHRLNVLLPAALAGASHRAGARLVHVSTEQVFRGDAAPYDRTDPVGPINRYGQQKADAEDRVHQLAPETAVTVRAPLLMGNSPSRRRSLHERLLADWAEGRVPKLYRDEFRQVCTADDLAEVLLALAARRDLTGIHQWAGAEVLSRLELGRRIRSHFRLAEPAAPIVDVARADHPEAAQSRPANLALTVTSLTVALVRQPQTLAEQLATLQVPGHLHAALTRLQAP